LSGLKRARAAPPPVPEKQALKRTATSLRRGGAASEEAHQLISMKKVPGREGKARGLAVAIYGGEIEARKKRGGRKKNQDIAAVNYSRSPNRGGNLL